MDPQVSSYLRLFASQMTYHGETRLSLTLQLELQPELRKALGSALLRPLLPRDYTLTELKQGFVDNYFLLNVDNKDSHAKLWRSLGLFAGLGELKLVQLLLSRAPEPRDFQYHILKSALESHHAPTVADGFLQARQRQLALWTLSLGPVRLSPQLASKLEEIQES